MRSTLVTSVLPKNAVPGSRSEVHFAELSRPASPPRSRRRRPVSATVRPSCCIDTARGGASRLPLAAACSACWPCWSAQVRSSSSRRRVPITRSQMAFIRGVLGKVGGNGPQSPALVPRCWPGSAADSSSAGHEFERWLVVSASARARSRRWGSVSADGLANETAKDELGRPATLTTGRTWAANANAPPETS